MPELPAGGGPAGVNEELPNSEEPPLGVVVVLLFPKGEPAGFIVFAKSGIVCVEVGVSVVLFGV